MTEAYRIVTLGTSATGKTSITNRYVNNDFNETPISTIGASFLIKKIYRPNGKSVRFDIWDTCGMERYNSIAPIYYKAARVCLVVYDITNRTTFEKAQTWVAILLQEANIDVIIALIGNKIDLADDRSVSYNEGKEYADSQRLLFYEVSAKTGQGINEIFTEILKILTHYEKERENNAEGSYEYDDHGDDFFETHSHLNIKGATSNVIDFSSSIFSYLKC